MNASETSSCAPSGPASVLAPTLEKAGGRPGRTASGHSRLPTVDARADTMSEAPRRRHPACRDRPIPAGFRHKPSPMVHGSRHAHRSAPARRCLDQPGAIAPATSTAPARRLAKGAVPMIKRPARNTGDRARRWLPTSSSILLAGAALFIVLGGSAVAATGLIHASDIAPGAVTSRAIRAGAVEPKLSE